MFLNMQPTPRELEITRMIGQRLPFLMLVVQVLPVLLVCIFLNKYIFKSADGLNGAING